MRKLSAFFSSFISLSINEKIDFPFAKELAQNKNKPPKQLSFGVLDFFCFACSNSFSVLSLALSLFRLVDLLGTNHRNTIYVIHSYCYLI